ncbi:histidine-type phosphatase [Roseixanthobacter glucoisosaccharinicivorans]|uniref:histidine-type phosphatase n=1 Tax=Roseixanthobacter glucoisosaccharinicivorans TaxID=3119923 RepID=UPI00372842D5
MPYRIVVGVFLAFSTLCGAALANPGAAQAPAGLAAPAGARLQGMVLLSRHGLRGPTKATHCDTAEEAGECFDALASRPWPADVAAGHLLPEGYGRVARLGQFYRTHYAALGMLAGGACPPRHAVAFTADTSERTIVTAAALMDAMFPGCAIPGWSISPDVYKGPSCGFDPALAARAAQAMAGGSWAAVAAGELRAPLAAMDAALGPFSDAGCAAHGAAAPCSLSTVPISAEAPGPIALATAPSEQFLMQYAAGHPADEVAWGRLEAASGRPLPEALTFVSAIHAFYDRAAHMPKYQAVKKGSPVLARMLAALEAAANNGPVLQVFASHDDLILNVAGMLDLNWQLESYQPEQAPPGGAVAFELWRSADGERMVRLVYFAQTIAQMHADAELSDVAPPATALLPLPACAGGADGLCPWPRFRQIAQEAIDPACVGKPEH